MSNNDPLRTLAQVTEKPFKSRIPLVAGFRSLWNSMAARWYVQPLTAQQNHFNINVAERVIANETQQIAIDEAHVDQTRTIAELTTQVTQLTRRIAALEAQIAQTNSADSTPS